MHTNPFNDNNDIDLVVDFNKAKVNEHFNNYFEKKYSLEDLLDRDIDLLEELTIMNLYLKKNIDSTKTLIYE